MVAFARELEQHPAQVVLVVDDLTPTMACSIVAKKKGIKVAHLVAGTRSFDMDMPKEVNSMITDGLSDYLFTAGMVANRNLNQTGTEQAHVHFVGNILIDTLRYNRTRLQRPVAFSIMGLKEKRIPLANIEQTFIAKQGHNTESHLPHYTGKNRQADRGAAPYICKKQAVCFRNYFRKVIYITTATLFVIRIFSEPCLGYHYRFGQCSGRSYFFRNPLHDIKHVCRTSRNSDNRHKPAGGENSEILADVLDILNKGEWQKGHLPERWDGHAAERIVQTLLGEHN